MIARALPIFLAVVLVARAVAGAQRGDSSRAPDRFAALSEVRLDSLYEPLHYLMHADERGIYPTLTLGGKRDYLRRFWARRNPTPGAPRNAAADSFYTRIDYANRAFREGGAAQIPGWRTDRGRIYSTYGPPDDILSRSQPLGTLPYEVWKYTGKKPQKYCFVDLTGFGIYVLVWTNEFRERSDADLLQLLGREAYDDVLQF